MASARPERPSALGGAGPTGAAFLRATPAFNWAIRSLPPAGLGATCFVGFGRTSFAGAGAASGKSSAGSTPSALIFCSTAPWGRCILSIFSYLARAGSPDAAAGSGGLGRGGGGGGLGRDGVGGGAGEDTGADAGGAGATGAGAGSAFFGEGVGGDAAGKSRRAGDWTAS